MLDDPKLFFNLVTRDALLIFDGQAHLLEGPFLSREDAERASEELMDRITSEEKEASAHAATSRKAPDSKRNSRHH